MAAPFQTEQSTVEPSIHNPSPIAVRVKSQRKIPPTPFLKILPVVAAGVIAASLTQAPLWIATLCAVLSLSGAAVTGGKSTTATILTYCALFFGAAAMTCLTSPRTVIPHGKPIVATMVITDTPVRSGERYKSTARIDRYKVRGDSAGLWKRSDEMAIIRFDTTLSLKPGQRIVAAGYASEADSSAYTGYLHLMRVRGYTQNIWIGKPEEVLILPGENRSPRFMAAKLQAGAAERLSRLGLKPEQLAAAAAMSIGDHSGLTPEIRNGYSSTGASHLLAVSGLHVGIVAMLVNILLYLMPAFRYGHIVKNAAAIAAIWGYAALTGLSPSVVRAAMMFSGVQASLAASRSRNSLNILLATASVMLLINPSYAADPSFLLSFAAVGGIFMLYRPLSRSVHTRYRIVNVFWSIFMVGLAATLATAPLVSFYFGRIPIIGLIINPVLIVTANITVLFSLLWTALPLELLRPLFCSVIGFSTDLQNTLIGICAAKGWASLPLRLEAWQAAALYTASIALYLWLAGRTTARKEPLLTDTL